mgnify:CR=1 FL=1
MIKAILMDFNGVIINDEPVQMKAYQEILSEEGIDLSEADYLDSLTLMSDLDKYESQKGVTLMTLHSAKGLEYKVVFLAGMEEGILPHSNSLEHNEDLEEERRLCYVGMTRAREQLYCIHSRERRLHGRFREQSPSPFLAEIPEEVKEEVGSRRPALSSFREPRPSPGSAPRSRPLPRGEGAASSAVASFFQGSAVQFDPSAIRPARSDTSRPDLKRGQRVRHEMFGDGTILTMEGSGPDAKLTVYFDRAGSKKFIAKYAKLTRI